MRFLFSISCFVFCLSMQLCWGAVPTWERLANVEATEDGWKTTGGDPWLASEAYDPVIPAERHYLKLVLRANHSFDLWLYWHLQGEPTHSDRSVNKFIQIAEPGEPQTFWMNLDHKDSFEGVWFLRLDPGHGPGLDFSIDELSFHTRAEVPLEALTTMVDFRAITSKLHYRPDEPIEYKAMITTRDYPDRPSSKIFTAEIVNAEGETVASTFQQFGIHPTHNMRELWGRFEPLPTLAPGKYTLKASVTDQRSDVHLSSTHDFGISGPDDMMLFEVPFKYLKDFTIIQDHQGLWHVFSITGDLIGTNDWTEDGQERTFSHSTSPDLIHWTHHLPVLSINYETYPDGNGYYEDRNIWAPHVIEHEGRYYMFYTSINSHVSQSISLATSSDLFHWEQHPDNPVFTLEGVEWADWGRDRWANLRDPMVIRDGDTFYMYATASEKGSPPPGVIAIAESRDLIHWEDPIAVLPQAGAPESVQVWKDGGYYYLTAGATTARSKHPKNGWERIPFERPAISTMEPYVGTSNGFADEIQPLGNGEFLWATLTWRSWGNSIYFLKPLTDAEGAPVGFESPFDLEGE